MSHEAFAIAEKRFYLKTSCLEAPDRGKKAVMSKPAWSLFWKFSCIAYHILMERATAV
jgi:hypothetical protein